MTPDANDLCVFAVKRGDIEKRIDPHANHPKFQVIFNRLKKYTVLPLKDYATNIFSGITPKSGGDAYTESEDGVLFVKSGCLSNDGYITIDETSRIKHETHNGLMKSSQLRYKDVLIAIVGATIGKVGLFDLTVDANINQAIAAVRLNDNLLPEFLVAYLLSPIGQTYLEFLKRPVARANINLQEIGEIGIPLLSVDQQERFINLFYYYRDQKEQKLKQADELLSKTSDYILKELGIGEIVYKENLGRATTLSQIRKDNTLGVEYYHPERMKALHSLLSNPLLRLEKLGDIVFFHRNVVAISDSSNYLGLAGVESQTGELSGAKEEAAGQAYCYTKGNVLYGRLRPYLNKVLYAEKDGICSTEFHVMEVKDENEILPEYLSEILRSNLILSQTRHMMTGNTHPRISNDDMKNLYIPIPNITLQKTIIAEIHNRRIKARQLKIEAEREWKAAKEQFEKELLTEH